jgi:hypothetical protein
MLCSACKEVCELSALELVPDKGIMETLAINEMKSGEM